MKIRTAQLEDAQALGILMEQLSDNPSDIELIKVEISEISKLSNYRLLVAENERGEVVGSIMGIICHDLCGSCRPFMVIENVIALDSIRGQGVGRLLMEAVELFAIENNCYYIILVSGMSKEKAHGFYNHMGYLSETEKGFRKSLK